MARSAKNKKWLEIAMVSVCVLLPTALILPWHKLNKITEFFQYYAVSRLSQNGAYKEIYNLSTIRGTEHALGFQLAHVNAAFNVPPVISWIFYPLAFLDFRQSLYLWLFIVAVSAIIADLLFCRLLGLRGAKRVWTAALLGAMGPFATSMLKGDVAPLLLLALVGLFVNLKKRNFLMASIYQSLFWMQPQLILPLLVFELGIGQTYTVVITALIAVIGLLSSCLIGGVDIVNSWLLLYSKQIHTWSECLSDCNLEGQLLRFSVTADLANIIAFIAYGVLLIAAFIMGKGVKDKRWTLSIMLTTLIPLTLCLQLRSSTSELLLLFPAIICLILMPIKSWLKYARASLMMLTLLILCLPVYLLIDCNAIESSIYNPFFWLLFVFVACAFALERSSNGQNTNFDS